MEFSASLKRAMKTGCVVLGPDRTEKCMNDGRALMIILAENCPAAFRTKMGGKKTHASNGMKVPAQLSGPPVENPFR